MYLYRFLLFYFAAAALLSHKLSALCNNKVPVSLDIRGKDFGPGIYMSSVDLNDAKLFLYRSLGDHRIVEIIDGTEDTIWEGEGLETRYVQHLDSETLGEFLYFETGDSSTHDKRCFLKFDSDVQWRSCARTLFVLFLQRASQLVSVDLDIVNDKVIDIVDVADDESGKEGTGEMSRTIVPRETSFIQQVSQGDYKFWEFDSGNCDMCMDITLTGNVKKDTFLLELSIKSGTTAEISTLTFEKKGGVWSPKEEPPAQQIGKATGTGAGAQADAGPSTSGAILTIGVDETRPHAPALLFSSLTDGNGSGSSGILQTLDLGNVAAMQRFADVFYEFVPGPNTSIIDIRTRPRYGIDRLVDGNRVLWSSEVNYTSRVVALCQGEERLVSVKLFEAGGEASVYFRRDGSTWRQINKREYRVLKNRMAKFISVDLADHFDAVFKDVPQDDNKVYRKHQLVPAKRGIFSLVKYGSFVLWKYDEYVLDVCYTLVIFGTRASPFIIAVFATFDGNKRYVIYRPGPLSGTWIETKSIESYWPVLTTRGTPLLGNLPLRINDIGNRNLINFTTIAIPAQAKRDLPIHLNLANLNNVTGTKVVKSTYEGGARGTFVIAYAAYGICKVQDGEIVLWEAEAGTKGVSYVYLVEAGNYKMVQITQTHWGGRESSRYIRKGPHGWEWITRVDFVSDLRLWKKRVDLDIHDPGEDVYIDVEEDVENDADVDVDDVVDGATSRKRGDYEIVIIPPEDVFVERILDCGQPIWEFTDHEAQVVQGLVITGTFTRLSVELTVLDKNGNVEFLTSSKSGVDWSVSYSIGNGSHLVFDLEPVFDPLVSSSSMSARWFHDGRGFTDGSGGNGRSGGVWPL